MRGNVRGEGGNFIILDDGNVDQDYVSNVTREAANEYLDSNISLRESDPKRTCLINVQQRIHQFDLSGHMLSKGGPLVHFRLPMEFEADNPCITVSLSPGKSPWRDPRTQEGELLWPQRFDAQAVARAKANLRTEYNISGQLQQRPSPRQGGIIKKEWFQGWKKDLLPTSIFILQSWDTALTVGKDSCFSASTTWGVWQDDNGYNNLILLSCWRGKLEYPDLKEMMIRQSKGHLTTTLDGEIRGREPNRILIETAANGNSLIQDLRRSGISQVHGFNPRTYGFKSGLGAEDRSKVGRARIASSFIEDGFVWLPMIPPDFRQYRRYVDLFLEATTNFPRGDGADLVDSMSQALISLMHFGDVSYKGQKPDEPFMDWNQEARKVSRILDTRDNLYGRV